ncbi:MAG: hypothetical protein KBA03_03660 [Anaerolineaceae bacterium]|nr:hypothetical protein [Anaerolineaceae bacterium]
MKTKSDQKIMKPCPFCGHKNFVITELREIDAHEIKCTACGVTLEEPYSWNEIGEPLVWNKRPIEDELRARNAELETRIVKLDEIIDLLIEEGSKLEDFIYEHRTRPYPDVIVDWRKRLESVEAILAELEEEDEEK